MAGILKMLLPHRTFVKLQAMKVIQVSYTALEELESLIESEGYSEDFDYDGDGYLTQNDYHFLWDLFYLHYDEFVGADKYYYLDSKPSNWNTNYTSYYTKNGSTYAQVPSASTAPTFQQNKYYAKYDNPNLISLLHLKGLASSGGFETLYNVTGNGNQVIDNMDQIVMTRWLLYGKTANPYQSSYDEWKAGQNSLLSSDDTQAS